jgi:hypothetical protein
MTVTVGVLGDRCFSIPDRSGPEAEPRASY